MESQGTFSMVGKIYVVILLKSCPFCLPPNYCWDMINENIDG